jgi:hypothetical protein
VFTGAVDGTVSAFEGAVDQCRSGSCEPLWTADAGARVTGAPAVNQGQLYVGTNDGLIAYGLPDD